MAAGECPKGSSGFNNNGGAGGKFLSIACRRSTFSSLRWWEGSVAFEGIFLLRDSEMPGGGAYCAGTGRSVGPVMFVKSSLRATDSLRNEPERDRLGTLGVVVEVVCARFAATVLPPLPETRAAIEDDVSEDAFGVRSTCREGRRRVLGVGMVLPCCGVVERSLDVSLAAVGDFFFSRRHSMDGEGGKCDDSRGGEGGDNRIVTPSASTLEVRNTTGCGGGDQEQGASRIWTGGGGEGEITIHGDGGVEDDTEIRALETTDEDAD